ncbi:alpha/beta fold hydrolase [Novosphingobium sp. 9U]|uniref:alpha/beta fold hydrolase n=1 Tax=Novosphingobium sp. 9U TaxID=2653158 RepID=UPI00135A38B7|nr:alpha/beta hydrolase [Novosphingobium sp. 9U]
MNSDGIITEGFASLSRGGLAYLAAGPTDGPLLIFVHGWPELAISWRHQLPVFGQLGFRAVAVDMPGYGRSVVHDTHEAYELEHLAADLVEFQDYLGAHRSVWVGHDWGSVVVWSLAAHYPERCAAVASLCVPYRTVELGIDHLISTVNRDIYDPEEHPAGQWDYMLFHDKHFDRARAVFERNTEDFFKLMFRRGDASGANVPTITAGVCAREGWFGGDAPPPTMDRDPGVADEASLAAYIAAFQRTGFFGPDSYYVNSEANARFTAQSADDGYLDMPALFLSADYDHWCDTVRNVAFGAEMRRYCRNLTAVTIPAGHWTAQEEPTRTNAALTRWLATTSGVWPEASTPAWQPLPPSGNE